MIYSLDKTTINNYLDLNENQAIGELRKVLILQWLNLFKFSNRQILSEVIDVQSSAKYRIIQKLIERGYIEEIDSNYHSTKLIKLKRKGLSYLVGEEYAPDDSTLLSSNTIRSYTRVKHELGLQHLALGVIKKLRSEGFPELKLMKEYRVKTLSVDLVLQCPYSYHKVAVEYENSRKSRKRADYLIVQHYFNIKNGTFNEVHFGFKDESLMKGYASYVYEKPKRYKKNKNGTLTLVGDITLENEHLSQMYFGHIAKPGAYITAPYPQLDFLEHAKQREKNNAIKAKKEREKQKQYLREQLEDEIYDEVYEDAKNDARHELYNEIAYKIERQTQKQTYIEIRQIYDEMGIFKKGFKDLLQEHINSLEEE